MKHYNFKRFKEENSLDHKTPTSIRKHFNSSERQYAKREIADELEYLKKYKEIKIRDMYNLRRELDQRFENIRFDFARTLHRFDIPIHPGGHQTTFYNSYHYNDFYYEYDSAHMTEEELLEMLALLPSCNPDRYY